MSDTERAKILIVDDRPENLIALEAILEPLGTETIRANSGKEALRQVLVHDFAVILLDVQMPEMNGFETAQLIKSRERSRHTPIIFLTAISKDEEFVFEGYSVGAVDYMFKPFNPDVLRSKVSVFIDLYLKTEQLQRQGELLRESERREIELRHTAELRESEARVAEIVGSALEAIITFDEELRITLFNAAAEAMFGRRADEVMGERRMELFQPPIDAGFLERTCSGSASVPEAEEGRAAPEVHTLTGCRAAGEQFPVEASVSCLDLPGGKVYTVIARDISERRRSEEALRRQAVSLASTTAELQKANEELHRRQVELEQAMTARSRFYASMSHELRTPINAILGYNALMLDEIYGPLTEKQVHGLERTQKAAKHLLELVNDVLDLSKIEAGKIELALEPTSVTPIIEDLFVTVRPLSDQHGSTLSLELEGEPGKIVTDPRRVRQILLNLLSNAIKFGEGKAIRVTCAARDGGAVEIQVIDQGTGIAPGDQDKIFDEFVQLERPHEAEGTGLGLPISRRLAVLLGGTLEVESTPGVGSTFRLALPRETPGFGRSAQEQWVEGAEVGQA